MRPSNRRAAAGLLAVVAVAGLAAPAVAGRAADPDRKPAKKAADQKAGQKAPRKVDDKVTLFGSTCRTTVEGSRVVAYCHNPYPESDLVQLHTECERWWDIDADGSPVEVGPAQTVRLTDRCWKEVRAAWVSHHRM
ncbi:hypothetical protein [Streptomyces sp. ISL-100]|uniref:hypothetical protein n=1 Tax=Streptomyces sp. ISL-100 TaxID=2819173 RepID=UPI001BEC062E|nr:hypothetical protein [Streptomyces sp. ISL-100]MBT2395048.1 hypothetical protein [Streptomyces sp. ISL-100]